MSRPFAGRGPEIAALCCILAAGAAARMWFVSAGLPYAVGIDEPQVIDRALRILHTGDWNTHLFDYPTLVIYFHAVLAIGRFLYGATAGEWNSLDTLDVSAIYVAARIASAAIGVATVWLVFRLGVELGSRRVGLLAALLLAVHPMHVRESHFALTDVPVTALTTLTVWLAVRAGKRRTPGAYASAGVAAGLAAAAKYNGGIAFIAIVVVWLLHDRTSADRWHKTAAAVVGLAAAFLCAAPYTILDLPSFLNGFAAQFARFAGGSRSGESAWLLYVKHLSLSGRWWIPMTLLGAAIVAMRPRERVGWAPVAVFLAAYFYALAAHAPVFGRYALPLLPESCLFVAVPIVSLVEWIGRFGWLSAPRVQRAALTAAGLLFAAPFVVIVVRWLGDVRRPDTRTIAATWMSAHLPRGTSVAIENSGPTYVTQAGFRVLPIGLLMDHPPEWYRGRADYLVISSRDRTAEYEAAGPLMFEITPTAQRWGPGIKIVKVAGDQRTGVER